MLIKLISDAAAALATLILHIVFQIYLCITDFTLNPNAYSTYIPGVDQFGTIMLAVGWILLIGTFLSEIVSSMSAPLVGKETKISPLQLVLKFIIYCIIFWASQELVKYFMLNVINPLLTAWEDFVNGWNNGYFATLINSVKNSHISFENCVNYDDCVRSLVSLSWLWALVFSAVIGYNVFMAAFNMVERFLCLIIYYYMAPVAIALGFSDERSEMCKQYFMTLIAQVLAIGLNYTIFALGMNKIAEFSNANGLEMMTSSLKNFVMATVLFSIAKNSEKILNNFNLRSLPTMDSARSFVMGAAGAMRSFMAPMRLYRTATGYKDMVAERSTRKSRREAYAVKGTADSALAMKNNKQGILPTVNYDAKNKKVNVNAQELDDKELKAKAVADGVISPGGKTFEEMKKNDIAFGEYKKQYQQACSLKEQSAKNFENAVNGKGTMTVGDLNNAFGLNEQLNKGCSEKNPNFKLDDGEKVKIDSEGNLHFHATTRTKDGFNELKEFAINPNQTMANGLIVDNKRFSSKAMDLDNGLNQMLEVTPAGNRIDFTPCAFGVNQMDSHEVLRSNALGLSIEDLGANKHQLSAKDLTDRGDFVHTLGGRVDSAVYDKDSGICVAKVQIPDKNAENGFREQYFALMSRDNKAYQEKEAGKELGNTGALFNQKAAIMEVGNNQVAIPIDPVPYDQTSSNYDEGRHENWSSFTNPEKIKESTGLKSAPYTELRTQKRRPGEISRDKRIYEEKLREKTNLEEKVRDAQWYENQDDYSFEEIKKMESLNDRITQLSEEMKTIGSKDQAYKAHREVLNKRNADNNAAYNSKKRNENKYFEER